MTIPVQIPFNQYAASGINDTFAFTFRILSSDDLFVSIDGVSQIEGIDYEIEDLTDLGGNVVFTDIPVSNQIISFIRQTPVDQDVVYTPFDPFPAKTHEGALDKLTMIFQERRASDNEGIGLPLDPSGFFWDAKNLQIQFVQQPLAPQDAATKRYVDDAFGGEPFDPTSDQTITGLWAFTQPIPGATLGNARQDADETIVGAWSFNQRVELGVGLSLPNSINMTVREVGGTPRVFFIMTTANNMSWGNALNTQQYAGLQHQVFHALDGLVYRSVSQDEGSLEVADDVGGFHPVAKVSFDETITAQWNFSGNPIFSDGMLLTNNDALSGLNPSATPLNLIKADATGHVEVGDPSADLELISAGGLDFNGAPLNDDNGLIRLTNAGKVPASLLPFSALEFQGTHDASGGTNPVNGVDNGEFYIINVAGTLTVFVDQSGTPVATAVNPGDYLVWLNTDIAAAQGWYLVVRESPVFIDSDNVTYDPTSSRWVETTVQDVLDEISDRAALKTESETVVSIWTFDTLTIFRAQIRLFNNQAIQWRNGADDAWLNGIRLSTGDVLILGTQVTDAIWHFNNNISIRADDVVVAEFVPLANGSLLVRDELGVPSPVAKTGANETISGNWEFTGPDAITLGFGSNPKIRYQRDASDLDEKLWDTVVTGNSMLHRLRADDESGGTNWMEIFRDGVQALRTTFRIANQQVLDIVSRSLGSVLVYDRFGTARKVGYRAPAWRSQNANHSVIQDDEGTIMNTSTSNITYTLDQLEAFTTFRIVNRAAGNITIAQGAGVTISVQTGGGTVTGNITLAPGSVIEVSYRNATNAEVFGNGIS